MAVAQPPPHPSSTYMARAVPQLGPNTAEFQAVRDERPCPGWPPQHHRPLIAFGAAAGAMSVPLLIVYAFVAGDPDAAIAGRTLLLSAGLVLAVLAGCCFIATVVVRANDRAIIQGAEYGVREVHALQTLHGELQAVSTHMAATVARLEAVLGRRVNAVEERLEEAEQRADEQAGTRDLLRGVAAWAVDIDQRLAAVHAHLRQGDEVAAPSPNGKRDSSPMELSDEAMRGYFLGFYDRQTNADPDGN